MLVGGYLGTSACNFACGPCTVDITVLSLNCSLLDLNGRDPKVLLAFADTGWTASLDKKLIIS